MGGKIVIAIKARDRMEHLGYESTPTHSGVRQQTSGRYSLRVDKNN